MKRLTRTDKQILMNELVSQAGQDKVIFGTKEGRKRSEQPSTLSRTKIPLGRTISVQNCLKQIHSYQETYFSRS